MNKELKKNHDYNPLEYEINLIIRKNNLPKCLYIPLLQINERMEGFLADQDANELLAIKDYIEAVRAERSGSKNQNGIYERLIQFSKKLGDDKYHETVLTFDEQIVQIIKILKDYGVENPNTVHDTIDNLFELSLNEVLNHFPTPQS